MKITILTLFPEMFVGPFSHSILKRAQEKKLLEIELINIRDFGIGPHKTVDDTPYGGGVGMVMKVDVVAEAITSSKCKVKNSKCKERVVLMDARGKRFDQPTAQEYSQLDHLILIAGHYEGIDERILDFVDEQISIGDFVLTGGEIPAMAITDAVVRLIPGVITENATTFESFGSIDVINEQTLLEYPQYTKPQNFEGKDVPVVLLSGNHAEIEKWRKEKAAEITKKNRPDLNK